MYDRMYSCEPKYTWSFRKSISLLRLGYNQRGLSQTAMNCKDEIWAKPVSSGDRTTTLKRSASEGQKLGFEPCRFPSVLEGWPGRP